MIHNYFALGWIIRSLYSSSRHILNLSRRLTKGLTAILYDLTSKVFCQWRGRDWERFIFKPIKSQVLIVPLKIVWILQNFFFFFPHLSLSIQNFGGSVSKEFTWNAGDLGLIPELGGSPGGGHGNPLQYSCLENPHGQRSLAGYSPWGHWESMTEQLSTAHPYLIISGPKKPAGTFSMLPVNLLSQTHQFVRLFYFSTLLQTTILSNFPPLHNKDHIFSNLQNQLSPSFQDSPAFIFNGLPDFINRLLKAFLLLLTA